MATVCQAVWKILRNKKKKCVLYPQQGYSIIQKGSITFRSKPADWVRQDAIKIWIVGNESRSTERQIQNSEEKMLLKQKR